MVKSLHLNLIKCTYNKISFLTNLFVNKTFKLKEKVGHEKAKNYATSLIK
jgi:hypothetical protein